MTKLILIFIMLLLTLCYMGLVRDTVELHVSSFPGEGGPRGVAFDFVGYSLL